MVVRGRQAYNEVASILPATKGVSIESLNFQLDRASQLSLHGLNSGVLAVPSNLHQADESFERRVHCTRHKCGHGRNQCGCSCISSDHGKKHIFMDAMDYYSPRRKGQPGRVLDEENEGVTDDVREGVNE
jgi:hypothetical protein